LLAAATSSRLATAQLRWDAGAEAGISRRFTTGAPPGAPSPGFGPMVELQGHVALVPMVRVGIYLAEDLSPAGDRLRSFSAGGIHLRASPPLLPSGWRTWLFAGLGFAWAYDGGAHTSGQLFDVPFGLGLGRKLGGSFLAFAELGARAGFGFYGAMYGAVPPGSTAENANSPLGHDAVALTLSVGLSLDE
jgi:hypothetical protein